MEEEDSKLNLEIEAEVEEDISEPPEVDIEEEEEINIEELDDLLTSISRNKTNTDYYIRLEGTKEYVNTGIFSKQDMINQEIKKVLSSKFTNMNQDYRKNIIATLEKVDIEHKSIMLLVIALLIAQNVNNKNTKLTKEIYEKQFEKYQNIIMSEVHDRPNQEMIKLEYKAVLLNYIIYLKFNISSLSQII